MSWWPSPSRFLETFWLFLLFVADLYPVPLRRFQDSKPPTPTNKQILANECWFSDDLMLVPSLFIWHHHCPISFHAYVGTRPTPCLISCQPFEDAEWFKIAWDTQGPNWGPRTWSSRDDGLLYFFWRKSWDCMIFGHWFFVSLKGSNHLLRWWLGCIITSIERYLGSNTILRRWLDP